MRQTEVLPRAFAMPLTNPAYPPGPYRFVNREYLIITYRTDPAKLRALAFGMGKNRRCPGDFDPLGLDLRDPGLTGPRRSPNAAPTLSCGKRGFANAGAPVGGRV